MKRLLLETFLSLLEKVRPVRSGRLRFRLRPHLGRSWGGPLNGQSMRCLLVAEVIQKVSPSCIVETGTYLGTTTEWLSAFQLPIWSSEHSERSFGYASQRLLAVPNVRVVNADSRQFLRDLLGRELRDQQSDAFLFYLDAHWEHDLPLAEEMDIVFSACRRAVVIVDDFQVPDDSGYSYDDYGVGKALTHEYVADCVRKHDLAVYYPAIRSEQETGSRRGCAVFVRNQEMRDVLDTVTLLRFDAHLSKGRSE